MILPLVIVVVLPFDAGPRAWTLTPPPAQTSTPAPIARTLSAEERHIVAHARERAEEAVAFLERVVNINSGTQNLSGIRSVGEIFRKELTALGFETRWIPMPDSLNRAGHLFAEHNGDRGRRIILIGHLDTVFEPDSPFQRFVRDGERATGPGVIDMKGGDAVMVYALKALHDTGALEGSRIIVALIGDEERIGKPISVSRVDLIEAAKRSDVALGFEPAYRGIETATVARRGSSRWTLTVRGTRGHSSQIFAEFGSGAIFETARILDDFHDELRGEEHLTFSPGLILGGTEVEYQPEESRGSAFGKANVIPQSAKVNGDLRFIHEDQKELARNRMREIVARNLPGTSAEITFRDSYPAMPPTAGNHTLLVELDAIQRALGYGPVEALDPGLRGAADISFAAPYTDALDGIGPAGSGSHGLEETIDLTTFPIAVERAALLIYRLTR
jgi:glutamate carboxypeptidase